MHRPRIPWLGATLALFLVGPTAGAVPPPDLEQALRPTETDNALGQAQNATALQVLGQLQAANQARLEAGRRRADAEQSRAELLAEAARLRLETARVRAETRELRARSAELRESLGPVEARAEGLDSLERQLADAIHAALDDLAQQVPPGVVAARAPEDSTGKQVFQLALDRLETTERRLASVSVEVVQGRQGSERLGVELLRLGGAAAWWKSLDGAHAGWARMEPGGLQLEPAPSSDLQERIARAIQMAKGRTTVRPLALPLAPDGPARSESGGPGGAP